MKKEIRRGRERTEKRRKSREKKVAFLFLFSVEGAQKENEKKGRKYKRGKRRK